MVQQKLFPELPQGGAARRADPPTSKVAAKSLNATELEARAVNLLRKHPSGLTTHEMADILQIPLVSVSPRMAPLVRKGIIEDSGLKREGPSGRKSIMWRLKR